MATGTIEPNIPNTPNTATDSWEPLVGQHILARQGDNHVSLTEWSTSTVVPEVASGSSIEVNGSMISYSSNTALVQESGLVSGTVYLLIDTSDSANAYPTLVNDAPVWDAGKNGFYRGANERYTGHQMYWDGGSSYTKKRLFGNNQGSLSFKEASTGDFIIDGDLDVGDDLDVNGNAKIDGGVYTNNFYLKTRYLTGSRTEGDAGISHGLSGSSILSVIAACHWSSSSADSDWYPVGQGYGTPDSGDAYTKWSSTKVYVKNLSTSWDKLRITIIYKG